VIFLPSFALSVLKKYICAMGCKPDNICNPAKLIVNFNKFENCYKSEIEHPKSEIN